MFERLIKLVYDLYGEIDMVFIKQERAYDLYCFFRTGNSKNVQVIFNYSLISTWFLKKAKRKKNKQVGGGKASVVKEIF